MKYLLTVAALALALPAGAEAASRSSKSTAKDSGANVACKEAQRKAKANRRNSSLTPAAEESLNRGMARNVLQSIEDRLRIQRFGN